MFSWYVSNKEVKANGIIASTSGEQYTLHLERGTFSYVESGEDNPSFDQNQGWIWKWKETDNMVFSDIQPGDTFYFRIVMDSQLDLTFDISFSRIKSALLENLVKAYVNKQLVKYTLTTDTSIVYQADSTVTVGDTIPLKTYYEFDSTDNKYTLTSDLTFQSGKTYYKIKPYYLGTFTPDTSVVVNDLVKPNTYYERSGSGTAESPYTYAMTTDTKYVSGKTYYKGRFILDSNPDFETNTYYEKGATPTTKNSIGYEYDTDKFNYLYTLDADDEVKINNKVLYDYDRTKDIVELKDYLIQNVFKVYDIGTKRDAQTVYGETNTSFTEDLYYYSYTQVAANATFNPKTTYYVRAPFYLNQSGTNITYVKTMDTEFKDGTTYYTRGAKTNAIYANSKIKPLVDASFSFDATANAKTYYYFALEFNEAASLETIDGIQSSNCYLYQTLSIDQVEVSKQNAD